MLIGTARGLLLLYRGLAVALAMDAFPRLALLALGTLTACISACHIRNTI